MQFDKVGADVRSFRGGERGTPREYGGWTAWKPSSELLTSLHRRTVC